LRTVCWLSFRISATSATARNSSIARSRDLRTQLGQLAVLLAQVEVLVEGGAPDPSMEAICAIVSSRFSRIAIAAPSFSGVIRRGGRPRGRGHARPRVPPGCARGSARARYAALAVMPRQSRWARVSRARSWWRARACRHNHGLARKASRLSGARYRSARVFGGVVRAKAPYLCRDPLSSAGSGLSG
jgi:hypothetical protein